MKGVFVTCTLAKEKLAIKELMNLLDEYAERWYGDESAETASKAEANSTDISIEDAFKKELESLKGPPAKKRFQCYTLRVVPLVEICQAEMPDILEMAKKVIPPIFDTSSDEEQLRFSIIFNRRNCDRVNRDELIPELTKIVGERHKVDYKTPDIYIILEAFKSVCGMCVTRDFSRLKKFNFETIFDEENAKRAFCLEKKSGGGSRRKEAKARHEREAEMARLRKRQREEAVHESENGGENSDAGDDGEAAEEAEVPEDLENKAKDD
ncbi:THUMP domain-containing protein 1 [Phlyctochytrium bullatum]|nr:THUMP domain-containing protein 1 [Phlyctochytrium bullatum]